MDMLKQLLISSYVKLALLIFLLTLAASFPLVCAAEEAAQTEENSEEEGKPQLPLQYYLVTPNVMTFYQNSGRRLGYIVVQVQIVVRGDEKYELLATHLPLIQDALTDFFNRQTKEIVTDLNQRENLRIQAKDRVASILEAELGEPIVEDLLFTQYVYQ
ncbi:flagellar basal body-associated FliL family protein [Aliikangiella sp. G2MR2-5]|uniref:flagellar basal body-associated FliL family protein n=1 Tax=Aliikangiella sp. G2MR2-5 TaxID=2788943 RepID=UPI0018AB8966|nr:flagellar basal body-associated FliL family protein [Aliikangiella sp. G2MR2-5]